MKNFRPSILLLTGNPSSRVPLVEFANNITKNLSLLLVGHIIKQKLPYKMRIKSIESQNDWLIKNNIKGFYLLNKANSLHEGVQNMIELSGLGRLKCNILMIGYKSSWQDCLEHDLLDYFKIIHTALDMHLGLCILRIGEGLDYADFFQTMECGHNNVQIVIDGVDGKPSSPNVLNKIDESEVDSRKTSETSLKIYSNLDIEKQSNQNTKPQIPVDALFAMKQFSRKQSEGYIDVWWISDDGGLTLLIPYILNNNSLWKRNQLRIFSIAKSPDEIEATHSR